MKTLLASALLALAVAPPAGAATFDVARDFGASVFRYGTVDSAGTFTAFGTADCGDIGVSSTCYRRNDRFQVVFQKDATQVLAHPGPNSTTAVLFVAPRTGDYTFSNITAASGDTGTVGVSAYLGGTVVPLFALTGGSSSFSLPTLTFGLTQGQSLGPVLDNAGSYFYDSTLLSGQISGAVPEPATWAMMIGGFGAVGGTLRRRRAQVRTRIAFA